MKDKINTIYQGNSIELLNTLEAKSIDLIFADPPYNLQLENDLLRPNSEKYNGVEDDWDKFSSIEEYDEFSRQWLEGCRRVMKDDGTIWVIGTYHNIYRIVKIMQDLGYWILNDILWIKTNPTPNFAGTRFTNAHETIIWAKKSKKQKKYTFNYQAMKALNGGKQMRSDWLIPICQGTERVKINGEKAHPTQKPEALLFRIILSASNIGDLVLDPFFGTGTTGAVAKKLKRNWIGIERSEKYIKVAQERIDNIKNNNVIPDYIYTTYSRKNAEKVKFSELIEAGLISIGDTLYSKNKLYTAQIKADSTLISGDKVGSIHSLSAYLLNKKTNNGWDYWYLNYANKFISLNILRDIYRKNILKIDIELVIDDYNNPEEVATLEDFFDEVA